MLTKAPRGTADILPADSYKWQYLKDTARKTAKVFGYGEIQTPVFEHTELFLRGVGDTTDVVQKEMYTFEDKAGRSITLRPEGTASAARAYLEHSLYALPSPVKLFYDITCYRYEKPQAGRMREFHQFGIESYGSDSPALDAEIIAVAATIFKNLGLQNIKLNINSIGCPECRSAYNDALKAYFKEHLDALCPTCHERLDKNPMRIIDCKCPECKVVAAGAPSILDSICDGCSEHFEKTQKYLTDMGIPFNIDATIVRGLDYYTKTVFEFVSTDIGAQGTICGGGRYDNLIESLGGNSIPGMGFAMGLERILLVMQAQGVTFPNEPTPDIYIASMGEFDFALKLCHSLRCAGVHAMCDLDSKSLKAQMKNADRMGAKYSMVIGENEVSQSKAKIKNMESGEGEEVSLCSEDIKNYINK